MLLTFQTSFSEQRGNSEQARKESRPHGSSLKDESPTYVVFFQTANSLTQSAGPGILQLMDGGYIRQDLLMAISLGAVFMGAMTYIGNGPNFMVKSIAEERGVKMPTFFGYLLCSIAILIPLFLIVTMVSL